ncbi:MAG: hypothetical protein KDE14_11725 [Rhodobacteraceae bacterium]|nr:hypothetical protein [Paracoccaceae bacterium]
MLRWVVWALQGLIAINALLHAVVLAAPPGPMQAQFGFMPVPLRILIAAAYVLCAVGLVVPEFVKRPRIVIRAAIALALVAAAEAVYLMTSDRSMAAMSRGTIVVLLLVLAGLRMRLLSKLIPN